jgi:hypothetical protein
LPLDNDGSHDILAGDHSFSDTAKELNMPRKIFKLVLIRGYTEAWYQLSEEEKTNVRESVHTAIKNAGAKMTTPYYDCRWANDKYQLFFIMEYPDIEGAIADTTGVEKADWFRYLDSETLLGIERES